MNRTSIDLIGARPTALRHGLSRTGVAISLLFGAAFGFGCDDVADPNATGDASSAVVTGSPDGSTVIADGAIPSAPDSGLTIPPWLLDGGFSLPPDGSITIPGFDAGIVGVNDSGMTTPVISSGKSPDASKLPAVKGACPALQDGTVTVAGSKVKLWVGSKPGPMVFYFHGTGSTPDEVQQGLSGATQDVKSNGGIVASWDGSNSQGSSTGSVWTVWYTGDFDAADQILACGIQKGLIDTSHIHVAGYSAGGLQTGAMLYMRSNYLASGIVFSGGKGFGAMGFQDPSNVPNAIMAHGAKGSDALILDFHDNSQQLGTDLKTAGAFVMDCDDGGSHVALSRLGIMGKAWQFMKDHPYGIKPSPYASGIPAGWPSYCKIW